MTDHHHLQVLVDVLTEKDFGPYYQPFIDLVPRGMSLSQALLVENAPLPDTVSHLSETEALYRYSEGKWSIKEVIIHLTDAERIFGYRAMRYARKDTTPLMGFEQDDFVAHAYADDIPLSQLLETYQLQRKGTLVLYQSFTADMLTTSGVASSYEMTVRAIGFLFLAHEIHHVNIIKERYLKSISA